LLLTVAVTLVPIGQAAADATESQRRIALTFDDATLGDGPLLTGEERTEKLIAALDDVGVEGAMFFITTRNVERNGEEGDRRVRRYVEAGHVLGNHSHSHLWLHQTSVEDYVADLDTAIARLAEFDGVTPYFRFPYLDEGRAYDKRDALRAALAERGLKNGYVTVDDYDWYMGSLVAEALEAGHEIDFDALRDVYVELLVDVARFYDEMAVEELGRSPQHVLLLHENDLAALFVDDLVRGLRADGWQIVPAVEAYRDPMADQEPDTLLLGQGRRGALLYEAGRSPEELLHVTADEDGLRAEFVRRGLLP
jgi:peptidoglycan/xylan/chitin deacetylase (PgdA/CDA1 family)